MELGSLPEWFTACAEVLAVCTALFLPQYRAYRDRKESLARMRRVTKGMLAALVDERQAPRPTPRSWKAPKNSSCTCACRSSC